MDKKYKSPQKEINSANGLIFIDIQKKIIITLKNHRYYLKIEK